MASTDNITLYGTATSGTDIGDTFTHTYMCRDLENGTAGAATGLVEQLERANRQLKAQLAETIDSNNKWLAYDRKRDELVNSLLLKNQELQQQLDALCRSRGCEGTSSDLPAGTSSDLPAGTSSNLQAGTSSDLQAGTGTSRLQADLQQYKQKAGQEEARRTHLETVNRRQQQYIHQLQNAPQRPEDRERIQLLQSQVQIFSEDFQQERHDRERAQGRLSELQVEVQLLQEQLSQFQQSHMAFLADRRRSTMDTYCDEYQRQVAARQQPNSSPSRLIAHGQNTSPPRLIAHGQDTSLSYLIAHSGLSADVHIDGHDDDDIIDVPMACGAEPASKTRPPCMSGLECPKCHQYFPVDDPLAFLEHNDQCEV